MVVHVVLMAHGRMAGTCVTGFLIMQAGLSFGTKSNSPLRLVMNNNASKLGWLGISR